MNVSFIGQDVIHLGTSFIVFCIPITCCMIVRNGVFCLVILEYIRKFSKIKTSLFRLNILLIALKDIYNAKRD